MNDPEFNVLMAGLIADSKKETAQALAKFGEDHPFSQILVSLDEAFDVIEARRNDLNHCHNDGQRKEIYEEIRSMVRDLDEILQSLTGDQQSLQWNEP